jgi:excisionase family DNA binding protein
MSGSSIFKPLEVRGTSLSNRFQFRAASRLGVHKMTVVRLIRDGLLPARQACVGAPYVIRADDLDRPAIQRVLTIGRAVSSDQQQESLSFQ